MTHAPPMMGCGHAANGWKGDQPVCVICFGLKPGADTVAAPVDLEGRQSRCACGSIVASSERLAFFEHRADFQFDSHYCGHAGWD